MAVQIPPSFLRPSQTTAINARATSQRIAGPPPADPPVEEAIPLVGTSLELMSVAGSTGLSAVLVGSAAVCIGLATVDSLESVTFAIAIPEIARQLSSAKVAIVQVDVRRR